MLLRLLAAQREHCYRTLAFGTGLDRQIVSQRVKGHPSVPIVCPKLRDGAEDSVQTEFSRNAQIKQPLCESPESPPAPSPSLETRGGGGGTGVKGQQEACPQDLFSSYKDI